MSINRTVLLGRLTKDPELHYSQNGTGICTFALAVDRRFSGQNGEKETDFLQIVVFGKTAEASASHLKKGQQAAVEGRIQVRNYENKEGRKVYVTEIVAENVQFLGGGESRERGQRFNDENPFNNDSKPIDILDDDLPF